MSAARVHNGRPLNGNGAEEAQSDPPAPHSIEAEQAVLGGLMMDASAYSDVAGVISVRDIYRNDHRLIFGAIEALARDDKPIDPVTVSEHLERRGDLEAAGGFAYLSQITRETPTAAYVRGYAEIVAERARLRGYQELANDAAGGVAAGLDSTQLEQLVLAKIPGTRSVFDPDRARLPSTFLDQSPEAVEQIVDGLYRRTAGQRASVGGAGKSTLTLFEMAHVICGEPLYGREIRRPGPCVLITAEDERGIVEYRLWRVLEDLQLSRPQREHVRANLYVEDLTGRPCRFVDLSENGSLVQTPAVRELVQRYRPVKPSFVSIDPMNLFGPGERFINDGEGELMRAGRFISAGLNATVRFEHHVGKARARERSADQYSGRGGSAAADNARFVHVLQVHEPDDEFTAPSRCTPKDIAEGNVLRLHVAKDSYGARIKAPLWILRNGFLFTHVVSDPQLDVDPMEAQLRRLYAFIESETNAGIRHTANSLDSRLMDLGVTRQEMRAALHVSIERKHLVEQSLPKDEQRGRRKTFLALGLRP